MTNAMTFGHSLADLTDGVTVFRQGVGKPMPLTSTSIDIDITAGLALVVTTRRFSNVEDVPIEAILTMPVGFEAVVTGLSATVDGRRLRAVAQPRVVARASYEAAIDEGKMAVLHEEALRGIHVLSIGQLAPGKEVEVELRMVQPLAISGNGPFLRLPMTAGQLYGATPLQPADDLITDARVRHVARLKVRADAGIPEISGLGPVGPEEMPHITLDRALEIVVRGGHFGSVLGASASGHQVRLDLRPRQAGETPLRLAVLVDRSGSTSDTIGQDDETVLSAMRRGLIEALSKARNDDHIEIWQFSDECQPIGCGRGTEILGVLKKALNSPGGGTQLGSAIRKVAGSGIQDILVLTDGQTWDALPPLASELNIRVSAVLVGKASLDANIGHLCAMTGGELFYAPEAEVAHSVRLALDGKRASGVLRELDMVDGRLQRVCREIGGVKLTASWSAAMEIGNGTDFGRFAAGLCLGQLDEEAAAALAVAEGLCSPATSLILVDDVGEASEGISETRKVPLMQAAVSMSVPDTCGGYGGFSRFRSPDRSARVMPPASAARPQAARSSYDIPMNQSFPESETRNGFPEFWDAEESFAFRPRSEFSQANLERLADGIDWETQVNRFLNKDFGGLREEEAKALDDLVAHPALAPVFAATDLSPKLVLLAWLAWRFVDHSHAAKRFARRVTGLMPGRNLIDEIDAVFCPADHAWRGEPGSGAQ